MNSKEKIKNAFIDILQYKDINDISITYIVKKANINRSTFYNNFTSINDLIECIREEMFNNIINLYKDESETMKHSYDYLKLFNHIYNNQKYYKTLFKLNFDFSNYYDYNLEKEESIKYYKNINNMDYHIEFFKAGISAIIKKWLNNNCDKTPSEMVNIIKEEYMSKNI